MENVFNTTELLEDKDMTIAQLKSTIKGLDTVYRELMSQHDALKTQHEARGAELEKAKLDISVLSAQLQQPDFSRLLRGLVSGEVEAMAKVHLASIDFTNLVDEYMQEHVRSYLESADFDVEGPIERAIEDALQNVRINFNGSRY